MLYELRIYHCVPGRLPDLLKRFDTITLNIWKQHGIEQAGFWTIAIGDSNQALYYFLKWQSLADREKKWAAFQADPEWISARAETERNGPIVARGRARHDRGQRAVRLRVSRGERREQRQHEQQDPHADQVALTQEQPGDGRGETGSEERGTACGECREP